MKENAIRWASRILAPLTLFEWGAILTYFYCSNRLAMFLHPDFRPLVLVTGGLLLVSAVCVLFPAEPAHADDDCSDLDCGHSKVKLTIGGLLAFVVLLLPIALAAKISPDGYGITMLRNRGLAESVHAAPAVAGLHASQPIVMPKAAAPKLDEHPVQIEVGDLLIAAQNHDSMQKFDGKLVEFNGQFVPSGGNQFELVRLLMLCCSADAQALAVQVESEHPVNFSDMTWAEVTGRVSFTKKDGVDVPVVAATAVTPIPQPPDPYVYYGGSRPVVHQATAKVKFVLPPR